MPQVVVITGATAGVGRATARAFARRKARIGLLARGVDRLTATAAEVEAVQMPALNTPQFDWARNKMPRRPQPVPPIFEPAVAAKAIVFAAHARRREVFVGGSTAAASIGNKLAPGLLDRYLARSGYLGQLTQEANPGGPDNLFAPVVGDRGAHGRFGALAHRRSAEFWAVRHRGLLAAGIVAVVTALLTVWPSRVAARAGSRRGAPGQRLIDAVQD